jgi:hypothetical protein
MLSPCDSVSSCCDSVTLQQKALIESLIETKASRIDSLPASYKKKNFFSPEILLQTMNMMLFGFGRRKALCTQYLWYAGYCAHNKVLALA